MKKILLLLAIIVFTTMSFTFLRDGNVGSESVFKVYTYSHIWYSQAEAQTDQTATVQYLTDHNFSIISSVINYTDMSEPFPDFWEVKIRYQDAPQ